MKKLLFTILMAAMCVMAWGADAFNITTYSSIPTGWNQENVDAGSYFKLNQNSYLESPTCAAHTGYKLTFKNAKFGSGNNPAITVQILNTNGEILKTFTTDAASSSTYLTNSFTIGDMTENFTVKFINPQYNAAARLQELKLTYTESSASIIIPTISLASGSYTGEQTVTITTPTGYSAAYTTNGTDPRLSGNGRIGLQAQNGPSHDITISESCTLKVVTTDWTNYSDVVERVYSISTAPEVSIPDATVSVAAGTYRGTQSVTITNLDEDNYAYYYTLDGTTPAIDGAMNPTGTTQEYTGAISITESCTLSILTTDLSDSKVNTFIYVIEVPYTVTIVEPEHGTITVTHNGAAVTSGEAFYKNDQLVITATPADGYKFRNLQVTDATTHTFSASNTKTWGMAEHAITIEANFDEIKHYTIQYSVNGSIASSQEDVEEGTALAFPNVTVPAGSDKVFVGWTDQAIEGTTNDAPTLVSTTGTCNANITYYAVFADATEGEGNAIHTITMPDTDPGWSGYSEHEIIDNQGATWTGRFSHFLDGSTRYWSLNKNANNYHFGSPKFSGKVISIKIHVRNSATSTRNIILRANNSTAQPSSSDLGTVYQVAANFNDEVSIPVRQEFDQFFVYVSGGLAFKSFTAEVEGSAIEYSEYCTTIPASSTQISISNWGYATYYNSQKGYTLPAGVEGYVAYMDNSKAFHFEKAYDPADVVPAGEALVLKAAQGEYTLAFATGGTAAVNNDLEGTDTQTVLTDDEAYYFYALSLNANSELSSVGFYWMNETGAAFTNGAHKAYLMVAKSAFAESSAPAHFTLEDEVTAVEDVEASDAVKFIENGVLYIRKNGQVYTATGMLVK